MTRLASWTRHLLTPGPSRELKQAIEQNQRTAQRAEAILSTWDREKSQQHLKTVRKYRA